MFKSSLTAQRGDFATFQERSHQSVSRPHLQGLTPSQNEKLQAILDRRISLTSSDPQDLPIDFTVREFVDHIFQWGCNPTIIGGASQSLFVEKQFSDVDIAVFVEQKFAPDFFTEVCCSFFQLKNPHFRIEHIKNYVRWSVLHQSMETQNFDFKFISIQDLTHLFDHDAMGIYLTPLHGLHGGISGHAGLVPCARTGTNTQSFREVVHCLETKKLRLTDPEWTKKTFLRIAGALTRGFTPDFPLTAHLCRELLTTHYTQEILQTELKFYIQGHLKEEEVPLFLANIITLLRDLGPSSQRDWILHFFEQTYNESLPEKLLLECYLNPGSSSFQKNHIITEQGALIRSIREVDEVVKFLSIEDKRIEILQSLAKKNYPYLADVLKALRKAKKISIQESFALQPMKKLIYSEEERVGLFRQLQQRFILERDDAFDDLEKAIGLLMNRKSSFILDPTFLAFCDRLKDLAEDPAFVDSIRGKILNFCDKKELDLDLQFEMLETGVIPLIEGLKEIHQGLKDPLFKKRAHLLFDRLKPQERTSLVTGIYLEQDHDLLQDLGREVILEAISSWRCELFLTKDKELNAFFDEDLDLKNHALEMLCSKEWTGCSKKNLVWIESLGPNLKKEVLFFRENFKSFSKKELREIVKKIPLELIDFTQLVEIFCHLGHKSKQLEDLEIRLLDELIDRQAEAVKYPDFFERAGVELLALEELPKKVCLKLLKEYPSREDADCPDWIKAVFLKFYATKSGASTPILGFEKMLSQKPISPSYMEVVSPSISSFFTNSCRSLLSLPRPIARGADDLLVEAKKPALTVENIYRFCPLKRECATAAFKDILNQSTDHKTLSAKLFDLLAFAEDIAEVSDVVSMDCYDILANFIKEGFDKGEPYSFDQVFEPIANSLVKVCSSLKRLPTYQQRVKRILTNLILTVFDPKDVRLCASFSPYKELLDFKIDEKEPFVIVQSLLVTLENPLEMMKILTQLHKEIVQNKISQDSLVLVGLMIQKTHHLLKTQSEEVSGGLALSLAECLGNLYISLLLVHQTLEKQHALDHPFYQYRFREIFRIAASTVSSFNLDRIAIEKKIMDDEVATTLSLSIVRIYEIILQTSTTQLLVNEKELFLDPLEPAMILALNLPEEESLFYHESRHLDLLGLFDSVLSIKDHPVQLEFFNKFRLKIQNTVQVFSSLPNGPIKASFKDFLTSFMSLLTRWRNSVSDLAFKDQIKEECRGILEYIKLFK